MSEIDEESAPRRWVIGWREKVSLPELGIDKIDAKIDSGALTSALHAVDIEEFQQDGAPWVSFTVPSAKRADAHCRLPLVDNRLVKNTSGVWAPRFFIKTRMLLGDRAWSIEISLADREQMGFELILGRTAVRGHDLLIDPDHSRLAGRPRPKKKRSAAKRAVKQ